MSKKAVLSFSIYFFVFILMVEWLKPVIELTDTDHLYLFSSYLLLSFLFYFVRLRWYYAAPLKLLFIGWVIISIYTDLSFFSLDAFSYLIEALRVNLAALITREWLEVTNPFRTFLFFLLLWMTTYLLNYWIRVRKNILLFFILTILFITILDTFSPYNGEKSIVIALVSGFIGMGLLYVQKIGIENKEQVKAPLLLGGVGSLVGILVISGTLAFILPKAGPSWPDPVPFFTSAKSSTSSGEGGSGVHRKVGYGENDENLGGAFVQDDTPVFTAAVPTKQYWKIETKDTYTSKGWIQSNTESQVSSYNVGELIQSDITPGEEERTAIASISMLQEYPFVMQPYGIKRVDALEPFTLSWSESNQKLTTFNGGSTVPITNYDVAYSEPVYSLKALRNTKIESLDSLTSEFDRYLQLPETLPTRVRELATSITDGDESLYEKAKSIERYFRQNGFRYDQQLAAIPEGDMDYVDQFLFDTKVGYCDNFSTSMVVLLRSEGIPARWVKGFAPGEIVQREDSVPVYEITNNNAHSWVEAYFPNIGWMTFEPTIGFSNSANLNYDLDIQTDELEAPEQTPTPTPKKPKPETESAEVSERLTEVMTRSVKWVLDRKAAFIWSIIGLAFIGLLAYRFRRKWLSKMLIPVYRARKNDWDTFEKMYHQLLKQLHSYGYVKEQGQTLTDYATQIDGYFNGNHMKKLTSVYEKGFYGGNKIEVDYVLMRESWENLINQLSG
ncbi:transglutaminase family protein [Psychrobacillus sp. OK032]|uniref:transglutaminase-like domain-containing protein n=1 Tax=Psychrobacillus sp. OK032 TaxID=1884358 RepID=UPI0008ACE432|nr:transglutaminase-like domain-containing protein [Psychrobacillus sp. OK032]SES38848.1 Transglutaminase-like superfamily protein [Psychrobacillus sp. OK032]